MDRFETLLVLAREMIDEGLRRRRTERDDTVNMVLIVFFVLWSIKKAQREVLCVLLVCYLSLLLFWFFVEAVLYDEAMPCEAPSPRLAKQVHDR